MEGGDNGEEMNIVHYTKDILATSNRKKGSGLVMLCTL